MFVSRVYNKRERESVVLSIPLYKHVADNRPIHFKQKHTWNACMLHPGYNLAPPNAHFLYISMEL